MRENNNEKLELVKINKDKESYEGRVVKSLKKLWIPIIILPLLVTLILTMINYFNFKPIYSANQTLFINRKVESGKSMDNLEAEMLKNAVNVFADMAKTSTVLSKVREKTGMNISDETLKAMITVVPKAHSQMLDLTVSSKDKEEALKVAKALASSLDETSANLRGEDIATVIDDSSEALIINKKFSVMDIIKNYIKYLALFITIALFYSLVKEAFVKKGR